MNSTTLLIVLATMFSAGGKMSKKLSGAKSALNNLLHGTFPAFVRDFVSKTVLLVAVASIALSGAELAWALVLDGVDQFGVIAQAKAFILVQTLLMVYAYVAGKTEYETLSSPSGDLIPYQNMRTVSEKWLGRLLWLVAKTYQDPRPFLREKLGMQFYNDNQNPCPVEGWDYQPVYRNAGSTAATAIVLWIMVSCGWLIGQGIWVHFFHAFDIPDVTRYGISHFNERVAHALAFLSTGIGVILLAVVGKVMGFILRKLIASFEQLATLGFKLAAPVLPYLTRDKIDEQTEQLFGKDGVDVLPEESIDRGMWIEQLSLILTFAPYALGIVLLPYEKVAAGLFIYSFFASVIAGVLIIAGNYYPERRAQLAKLIEDSLIVLWQRIYKYKAYLFIAAIYGGAIVTFLGRALWAETKGQSLLFWWYNMYAGITPTWVINHTWGTSLLLGLFTAVLTAGMAYVATKIGKDWTKSRKAAWAVVAHTGFFALYFMFAFAADGIADEREFYLFGKDMAATPVDITDVAVTAKPKVNSGRLTLRFNTTTKVEGVMELSESTATHWGLKSRFIPVRSAEVPEQSQEGSYTHPLLAILWGTDPDESSYQEHLVQTDLPRGAWGSYRLVLRDENGRVHQTVFQPFATDEDGDGYFLGGPMGPLDCDDTNAAIHPNADDATRDKVDQNCDGRDGPPLPPAPRAPTTPVTKTKNYNRGGGAPRCAGTACTVPRLKLAEGFRGQ